MNLEQAKRILNITKEDDKAAVKRKYRQMMGICHPDAAGADSPQYLIRAQEINEAYQLLKHADIYENPVKEPSSEKESSPWKGEINEKAFCDRNIYLYYSMEVTEAPQYYRAARGKYMWDPDEEEFPLFLTSIRHASKELLEQTEAHIKHLRAGDVIQEEKRFLFQTKLFLNLAWQYIHPVKTLRKIAAPESADSQGREIYHLKAFLGAKGSNRMFQALSQLKEGDILYPKALQENRIIVADSNGRELGCLSLEDDRLYFCVIPLLKKHLAQVKLRVKKTVAGNKLRPCRARAAVSLYIRLEAEAEKYEGSGQNLRIAEILDEYEEALK